MSVKHRIYVNQTITSLLNFVPQTLLVFFFQGADQLHQKRYFYCLLFRRTKASADSSFGVSLITHSRSFNRKLFLVVLLQRFQWRAMNHLGGSANKMRTNYSCQIDIVKQFIISSMSPHVYLSENESAREEVTRQRHY